MTSPNPMALEAKALEAADPKLIKYTEMLRHQCAYNGPCADNGDGCICSATELHRRAALPLPAAGEGLEPVAWQPGEQGLAVRALINLLAKLSTSPDNADYCLWLERIVAVLAASPIPPEVMK